MSRIDWTSGYPLEWRHCSCIRSGNKTSSSSKSTECKQDHSTLLLFLIWGKFFWFSWEIACNLNMFSVCTLIRNMDTGVKIALVLSCLQTFLQQVRCCMSGYKVAQPPPKLLMYISLLLDVDRYGEFEDKSRKKKRPLSAHYQ